MSVKGKAKPRLKRVGFGTWEAVPPKGYRITGTLSFEKSKVFVGIRKLEVEKPPVVVGFEKPDGTQVVAEFDSSITNWIDQRLKETGSKKEADRDGS